jgi:hypothetical protein
MYFTREDRLPERSLLASPHVILALCAFLALLLVGSDTVLRVHGIYGSRTLATVTIDEKRIVRGSRSARHLRAYFRQGGTRHALDLNRDEYNALSIGQSVRVIIVPGRFVGTHAVLDRPGLKLDAHTRAVVFGLIIVTHFGALFGLFHILLVRARRREAEGR